MTTEREMLELAALAAGIGPITWAGWDKSIPYFGDVPKRYKEFNPLKDNNAAFALMVRLKLRLEYVGDQACVDGFMAQGMDAEEAARKAITLAAAEIGKRMKEQG